jgi:hypothetical protein
VIHTSGNSYSAFEFYNTLANKTDFSDRLSAEAPEFTDRGLDVSIRQARKGLRGWLRKSLNTDINAGYDRNMLGQEELKNTISTYRRVWLVMDNAAGIKQVFLSQGNLWNSKEDFGQPPEIDKIWWVKEYFHTAMREKGPFTDLYLLERN